MKNIIYFLFFSLVFALSSTLAQASNTPEYVHVQADHTNLLYSSGETANFLIHQKINLSNTNFKFLVTETFTGLTGEYEIPVKDDIGIYISPILIGGNESLTVNVRLVNSDFKNCELPQVIATVPVLQTVTINLVVQASSF